MATKSAPKKASAAKKRFVADPTRGLHPDTQKPRTEEIRVLTPHDSPSRVGFGAPGIRAAGDPGPGPSRKSAKANASAPGSDSVPPAGGPVDHSMGATPRGQGRSQRDQTARKAAKKPAKKSSSKKPATTDK